MKLESLAQKQFINLSLLGHKWETRKRLILNDCWALRRREIGWVWGLGFGYVVVSDGS